MDGLSDIDVLVNLLDEKVSQGVGRIKIQMDEGKMDGSLSERYHHGRCDVASPFATGCIPTFDDSDKSN